MVDISSSLKTLFSAHSVILLPGSGTFAMEAVARQFCTNKRVLLIINGYFGYRWSEIITQGVITNDFISLLAETVHAESQFPAYHPPQIEKVLTLIEEKKPEIVLMSHTDTSTGIALTHDYIHAVSKAARSVGAFAFLDCIASGCIWANMKELQLDGIITAPQKAFCAPASVGIVLLSSEARQSLAKTKSTSFALDLQKWAQVMEQYESLGFVYHTTLPTTGIVQLQSSLQELLDFGPDRLQDAQIKLGANIRQILADRNLHSVAVPQFASSTVIVFYCEDPPSVVARFKSEGYKIAGGFSFYLNEKEKPKTFRIGLFGFEKLEHLEETTAQLEQAISKVFDSSRL